MLFSDKTGTLTAGEIALRASLGLDGAPTPELVGLGLLATELTPSHGHVPLELKVLTGNHERTAARVCEEVGLPVKGVARGDELAGLARLSSRSSCGARPSSRASARSRRRRSMLRVFHAHAPLLRTGWFVESLCTQALVHTLGFTALPARLLAILLGMIVTYLALVEAGKAYFFRSRSAPVNAASSSSGIA